MQPKKMDRQEADDGRVKVGPQVAGKDLTPGVVNQHKNQQRECTDEGEPNKCRITHHHPQEQTG